MFRSVAPHLIPENGVADIRNGLLEEDGSIYRRGGTTYRSTSGFGTNLTFVWDGTLSAGVRTVIASPTAYGRLNGDGTVTNLAGGGLTAPHRAAVVKGILVLPGGTTYDGTTVATAGRAATYYASAASRLITGEGARVYFSARQSDVPAPPAITSAGAFGANDYQELPGGVQVVGLQGVRDTVAIFTTGGVWLWSNVQMDLVDANGNPQQRLDQYSSDLVLWGDAGLAAWEGALVVPGLDGVWLMTVGAKSETPSAFRRLSDPISTLYRGYVTQGYRPGLASVYRDHYFLPILDGSNQFVDMLVCRLATGAWSRLDGFGAQLAGVTVKVDPSGLTGPLFIGAGTSGRVLNLKYFDPAPAVKNDADGTTHLWETTGRDVMIGNLGQPAQIRKVRAWYELTDEGEHPSLQAAFGSGSQFLLSTKWDDFKWDEAQWADAGDAQLQTAATDAPADPHGITPYTWTVSKRGRFLRWRVTCRYPTSNLKLRSMELFSRATGRR